MIKKAEKVKIEREKEGAKETEELRERYGGEDYVETVLDKEKEVMKEKEGEEEKTAFGETLAEEKERMDRAKEVEDELARQADAEKQEAETKEIEEKKSEKKPDEMGELIGRIQKAETKQEYNKLRGELEILDRRTREGEREEKKQAEKELGEAGREKLEKDLLAALEEPIENLVKSGSNVEKCDEKLEELKGKWFKGKKIRAIEAVKRLANNEKRESQGIISDIEDEYIQKGFSGSEVRKIIQEKIREKKSEGREELVGEAELNPEGKKKEQIKEFLEGVETEEELEKKLEDYTKEIIKDKDLTGNWEEDIKRIKKLSFEGKVKIEFEGLGKEVKKFEKEKGISYKEILKKGLAGAGVLSLFLFAFVFWYLGNTIEKAEKSAPKVPKAKK